MTDSTESDRHIFLQWLDDLQDFYQEHPLGTAMVVTHLLLIVLTGGIWLGWHLGGFVLYWARGGTPKHETAWWST